MPTCKKCGKSSPDLKLYDNMCGDCYIASHSASMVEREEKPTLGKISDLPPQEVYIDPPSDKTTKRVQRFICAFLALIVFIIVYILVSTSKPKETKLPSTPARTKAAVQAIAKTPKPTRTPKPTVAPTPTPEPEVDVSALPALEAAEYCAKQADEPRILETVSVANDNGIWITAKILNSWNEKSAIANCIQYALAVSERLFACEEVSVLNINFRVDTINEYGNSGESQALYVRITRETNGKFNHDYLSTKANTEPKAVLAVMDEYILSRFMDVGMDE